MTFVYYNSFTFITKNKYNMDLLKLPKLLKLPNEIYLEILKHTDPIDRIDVLCTCKLFLDLCLANLWKPCSHKSTRRLRIYMDDRLTIVYKGPVTGLLWAVSEGFLDYFRKWNTINEPFDASYDNYYPFIKSVENGHYDMVKYMLQGHKDDTHFKTVHPSVCLNSALDIACFNGNVPIIKLLLEDQRICLDKEYLYNQEDTEYSSCPLTQAICSDNVEAVQLILSEKRLEIPSLKEINKVKHTSPKVFKVLWQDERIDRELGKSILTRILTCYSDDEMFNNVEIVNLYPFP